MSFEFGVSKFFVVIFSQKNCRYYRNGEGQCPFGNKCFYRHALPSGQQVDVGPPRRIMSAEGRVAGGTQVRKSVKF